MGTVHKFKRPPKNEGQFRGYRPPQRGSSAADKPSRWQLRNWQKGLIAWTVLGLLAVGIWAIGRILGAN